MDTNDIILIVLATIGLSIIALYIFSTKYRRIAAVSARIFIGLVFVYSGFVKSVDPLGFQYKMTDYLTAFGMEWFIPTTLFMAVLLNLAEFLIGFVLVFGVRVKLFSWGALLFMIFFTPLTLYLAIKNPVHDCGCFGDAWILTNWQTFFKNLIFISMAIIVFIHRYRYWERMIPNWVKSTVVIGGVCIGLGIQTYAIMYDAIIDFRPWKIGNHISELVVPKPEKSDIFLVYKDKVTGKTEEYTSKTLPWQDEAKMAQIEFVEQRKVIIEPYKEAPIHDFVIADKEGNIYTDQLISNPQYHFLLISYDLKKSNQRSFQLMNTFAKECATENISFSFITGSTPKEIDAFMNDVKPEFEVYTADPVALKTIIRSNPGLLLLKDGYVIDKWPFRSFPNYADFKSNIKKYDENLAKWKEKDSIKFNAVNQ